MSKSIQRVVVISIILLFISVSSSALDTLTATDVLNVNQKLISSGKKYEAGFFVPPGANTDKIYLGIWYYKLTPTNTVVWVANRDTPGNHSSVVLKFVGSGQIVIAQQGDAIWSSNISSYVANPVLQLLDSGNLVVREADNSNADDYIWQSFDYPTDTLLPNQKLGWDRKTGLNRKLVSWKSSSDPSTGEYSFKLIPTGDPEIFLQQGNNITLFRTGPLVGLGLSGVPAMQPQTRINYTLPDTGDEIYYMFIMLDESIKSRVVMSSNGLQYRFTWSRETNEWHPYWFFPQDPCDNYMYCGSYGVCDSTNCHCPQGFVPRNHKKWLLRVWSGGCKRKTKLECETDGFVRSTNMKLPMSVNATVDRGKNLDECRMMCKKNCNCTAFSSARVLNGVRSGCVMWMEDLLDMTSYKDDGLDLYIRVAASDIGTTNSKTNMIGTTNSKTKMIVLNIVSVTTVIFLAITCYFAWKARRTKNYQNDDWELPLYDFDAIVSATNNFSNKNKLGEGGFGSVYKGVLNEGEEIAVKRLSKESRQGVEEFKNEVNLIAKLQHKNLVRLLGYSIKRDEKMVIYEYLCNRSLDSVLFHKERGLLLDWKRRFNIICGIAKGLSYLHHDSRLKIIHRDLKTSNILLDENMNPKISDFGMARIFLGDEMEAKNTSRVVGTFGYMAPEYAMDGIFSIKSDVFSFGVLVLEIIMGKTNKDFSKLRQEINLLGYAWKMWEEGKSTEILDLSIEDSYQQHEALKCIQIGLLCVQAQPKDRPTMSLVVTLLSSENATVQQPKLPGFYLNWRPKTETESFSINQVTVTTVDAR